MVLLLTMKKVFPLVILVICSLFLAGCSFKSLPAALQIRSKSVANVFIDGKLLGKTPYQASNLKGGELLIKLIPEADATPLVSWEGKVKVNSGVLTLIEREFAANEAASSGHVLTLEKIKDKKQASLSVVSDPDGALVKLDGESKGYTPLMIDKINEADHEIIISKEGYGDKVISAKAVLGYKLIVNAKLGQSMVLTPTPTPAEAVTPTPTGKIKKTTPTPTTTSSNVTPTSGAASQSLGYVLIKENSLGFLRVRNNPSGTEITKIQPIDPQRRYPLLEEKSGWYKITYEEGKEGWVSADSKYTQKATQ